MAAGEPMLATIPLGRFGKPIGMADAFLLLASSASDLISSETLMLDAATRRPDGVASL